MVEFLHLKNRAPLFSARQHVPLASYLLSPVRLSVCHRCG